MTNPYTPPRSGLPELSSLLPWRAWWYNPTLRTWPVWLFVALVTVPPAAFLLAADAGDGGAAAADLFAFYFAAAWLLVLRTVLRPPNLTGRMYAEIVVLALIVEVPLALGLESALPADGDNVFSTVAAVGLPEELAKILPVVAVALLHRRAWARLEPRDYLFLGAVSGLAFGAQEAIHYYAGYGDDLSRPEALEVMWRFVTDPVSHACWAGISAYFIGLAIQHREIATRAALAGLGLAIPAVLHGVNDWKPVNTSILWVAVTALSAVLFLAYATVGVTHAAASPNRGPRPRAASGHSSPTPTQTRSTAAATTGAAVAPRGWTRGPDGRWTRL
ncbi:PrsW family intramembrane metalloprotease [Actinomycetospora endophytica]|uniref:PrsW family intramembrane metalloprotease n=1 Tax=Actinomycetospora endophytica TaxID=2291215 RepID=A0ABS8P6P8_9PSEU|nr:PrsW family glutamic-type intramembrane protease [Actinomycetospora endophytica]MCD2193612.1 PrsW family intramembrane metalloprotease [Actinomycetospora endophytica]